MSVDLLAAVLAAAERTPAAPAITRGRRTLAFAGLRRRILGTAAGLRAAGLADGDRMLFSVRPGIDAVVLALGAIAAGGTVVFADPGAGESLFRTRTALAEPRWVAAESLLYAVSSGPLARLARRRGIVLPPYASIVPQARHVRAGRWLPGVPAAAHPLDRLARAAALPGPLGDPEAPALVIFTSGTTEAPKAVVHSRRSLGAGLGDFAAAAAIAPGEVVLTDQLMVGVPALIAGAHWVLPEPGLDPGARPERYLRAIAGVDVLFAVPAALARILDALAAMPPSARPTPRAILVGGAPVLGPLLRRVAEVLPGARLLAVYGMTEILPVAIADGAEKLAFVGDGDLVGDLAPSALARVDDGELVLAGPGLALGYLAAADPDPARDPGPARDPDAAPPAPSGRPAGLLVDRIAELRTGDLARIEPGPAGRRRLVLEGRAKDMLIRGTTNVYPGLVEPVVTTVPGVAEALLVGVPDAIGDDRLVLAVVPAEGPPPPAAGDPAHPLAVVVVAALPALIDVACLPDLVVAIPALPRAGRGAKPDRAALAVALAPLLPPADAGPGAGSAAGTRG